MPSVSPLHDLKTLVQSAHPLIAIDTSEEDRVIGLVRTVAEQLYMEPFEWAITRGFATSSGPF